MTFQNLFKYTEINIFNSHRKKILAEKCLFIAISFYHNISKLCIKISRVNKALKYFLGGSPVQSDLITEYIISKGKDKSVPVSFYIFRKLILTSKKAFKLISFLWIRFRSTVLWRMWQPLEVIGLRAPDRKFLCPQGDHVN